MYKKPRSNYGGSSVSYADEDESNSSDVVEEGVGEPLAYTRLVSRQNRYKSRPIMTSRYAVDDAPVAYERPPVSRRTIRPPTRLVNYRPRFRGQPDASFSSSDDTNGNDSPRALSTASATHGTAVSFAHVDGQKAYSTGFASQFPKTPKVVIDRDSRYGSFLNDYSDDYSN